MSQIESGTKTLGRPPKNPKLKVGKPKPVTMTEAQWEIVDAHLEATGEGWMDFVRRAIFDKIKSNETD